MARFAAWGCRPGMSGWHSFRRPETGWLEVWVLSVTPARQTAIRARARGPARSPDQPCSWFCSTRLRWTAPEISAPERQPRPARRCAARARSNGYRNSRGGRLSPYVRRRETQTGQHSSNTSPGAGEDQHADNTDETAFPGTRRHGCYDGPASPLPAFMQVTGLASFTGPLLPGRRQTSC